MHLEHFGDVSKIESVVGFCRSRQQLCTYTTVSFNTAINNGFHHLFTFDREELQKTPQNPAENHPQTSFCWRLYTHHTEMPEKPRCYLQIQGITHFQV